MSQIRDIIDQLRHTDGALAYARSTGDLEDELTQINLRALDKRRLDLMGRLERIQSAEQFDLVDYKIQTPDGHTFPIKAVGQSLQRFQELVTSIFDALRASPKLKYNVSAENAQLSTLNFAAAHHGSLGLSFTIPNDRLMAIETDLDRAIGLTFQVLAAPSSEQLRELAAIVGIASISKAYQWAEVHTRYGFDTKIGWSKSPEQQAAVEIDPERATRLREMIRATGDTEISSHTLEGTLVGLDVETDYFHIRPPEGEDVTGSLGEGFRAQFPWVINNFYSAQLTKEVTVRYATGEEKIHWILTFLENINC